MPAALTALAALSAAALAENFGIELRKGERAFFSETKISAFDGKNAVRDRLGFGFGVGDTWIVTAKKGTGFAVVARVDFSQS